MTASEKQLSVATIVLATLFWPALLPFTYLELLNKVKQATEQW